MQNKLAGSKRRAVPAKGAAKRARPTQPSAGGAAGGGPLALQPQKSSGGSTTTTYLSTLHHPTPFLATSPGHGLPCLCCSAYPCLKNSAQ